MRQSRSMKDFGLRLGLRSAGHVHQIVNGVTLPSQRVAVELEKLSGGRIRAADLNPKAGVEAA